MASVPPQKWDKWASIDQRRDDILKSLGSVLRQRRLSSLTMQDIADHLGLVKGNIYYYFKSKQDVFFHCHLKCMQISLDALDEVQAMAGSPDEKLQELLIQHIRCVIESPYGGVLLADLDALSPAQREHYVAMRDRFEQGVRDLIGAGIESGAFRPQDVRLAGFTLLGAINWMPKWYRPDGELSAESVAQGVADLLIQALR